MSFVPPPFISIMPNPAPGQMLAIVDGEAAAPAPATYIESWAQIFAPLDQFEKAAGRIVGIVPAERNRVLDEQLGLQHLDFGSSAHRSVTTERLGSIFHIRCNPLAGEESCTHEPASELTPDSFMKLCHKCLEELLKANPDFLGLEYDYDHFSEKETLHLEYRITDQALTETKEWVAKVEPLKHLIRLRNRAQERPWLIFSEPQAIEVDLHPLVLASEMRIADLSVAIGQYAGIDRYGYTAADNFAPGSIAEELHEINDALRVFRPSTARGGRSREDTTSKRNFYQKRYEEHGLMLASIALVEEKLGEPLPEDIKDAASGKYESGYKLYLYGVLKGRHRRDEILAGQKAARVAVEDEKKVLSELTSRLEAEVEWGRGWPAGAFNAPTFAQWSETSGIDFSGFKKASWA